MFDASRFVLYLLLLGITGQAAFACDNCITAGRSVGLVELGMSVDELEAVLGLPDEQNFLNEEPFVKPEHRAEATAADRAYNYFEKGLVAVFNHGKVTEIVVYLKPLHFTRSRVQIEAFDGKLPYGLLNTATLDEVLFESGGILDVDEPSGLRYVDNSLDGIGFMFQPVHRSDDTADQVWVLHVFAPLNLG